MLRQWLFVWNAQAEQAFTAETFNIPHAVNMANNCMVKANDRNL
jgi:hypothetical protein